MNNDVIDTLNGLMHSKGINAKEYAALDTAVKELSCKPILSSSSEDNAKNNTDILPDYFRGFCDGMVFLNDNVFDDYLSLISDNGGSSRILSLIFDDIKNVANDLHSVMAKNFFDNLPEDYVKTINESIKNGTYELVPSSKWWKENV